MAIHAQSVSELARTFGRIPAEMAAGLREELPQIGQILMRRSQANASWSSRIPGAHYVRARLGSSHGGVEVGVDRVAAPHARPYEGLAPGGNSRFFRHPTNDTPNTWVTQETRPFFRPAAEETAPEMETRIRALVRTVTRI